MSNRQQHGSPTCMGMRLRSVIGAKVAALLEEDGDGN